MNRRQLLRACGILGGFGIPAAWAQSKPTAKPTPRPSLRPTPKATPVPPQAPPVGLNIRYLNHSCFLFTASNFRILVNPFRSVGCTAGYPAPAIESDLVMMSSRLLDEGALDVVPGNPRVLFQPGDYEVDGIKIQGVRMAHDATTNRGDRFGINVAWRWKMAGIDIVHLGGAAAPITREQEILLAGPDLLLIPVGGGPKNYDAAGAQAAIQTLKPKLVIPTMYRTSTAGSECELEPLQAFLSLFPASQMAPSNPFSLTPQNIPATGPLVVTFAQK